MVLISLSLSIYITSDKILTYQNKRRIIIAVARININTLRDLLLADLQITFPTGLAELAEPLAEVEWILILERAFVDQLLLIVQADFKLVFAQNVRIGHVRGMVNQSRVCESARH